MDKKVLSVYEKLVYAAYAYFIILPLIYIIMLEYLVGEFSFAALVLIALLSVQAYFQHKLANLFIGIVMLAAGIYSTLESVTAALRAGFNSVTTTLTLASAMGVVFSGILIFSYTRFSFKDR